MKDFPLIFGQLLFLAISLWACSPSDISSPPKGYRNHSTLKIAYATGTLKLVETSPEVPESIRVYKDLIYKETPEKELKLDIYHTKDIREPAPLLVFIHGGSWKKGDKDDYRRYLLDYAEKGYVTATIAYRFSQEAPFPAALDDVVCAIKWLKSNASEYQIDPEKVGVIGGSAGGHLAMLLGFHANDSSYVSASECTSEMDSKVQAIVNLYGPADLTTSFSIQHPSVIQFIGTKYAENKEAYEKASPLFFITPNDPPSLIFHGTIDEIVPISQSDTLAAALRQNKVPVEYHRLKGWPHTMDAGLKVNAYCQYHMDAFFDQYLK